MRLETRSWKFFGIKSHVAIAALPGRKPLLTSFLPYLVPSPFSPKVTQTSKLQSSSPFPFIVLTWPFYQVWECWLTFSYQCQHVALQPGRDDSRIQPGAVSTILLWKILCFSPHVVRIADTNDRCGHLNLTLAIERNSEKPSGPSPAVCFSS